MNYKVMDSYEVKLVDEYETLCEKYRNLLRFIRKADYNELGQPLKCPLELLKEQADVMKRYMDILFLRGKHVGMNFNEYDFRIEYGDEYGRY